MRRVNRKRRAFGRQYVVRWDEDVRRFHVTLGAESIGFHKTEEGAAALAAAHAQCTALPAPDRTQPYAIATIRDESGTA